MLSNKSDTNFSKCPEESVVLYLGQHIRILVSHEEVGEQQGVISSSSVKADEV